MQCSESHTAPTRRCTTDQSCRAVTYFYSYYGTAVLEVNNEGAARSVVLRHVGTSSRDSSLPAGRGGMFLGPYFSARYVIFPDAVLCGSLRCGTARYAETHMYLRFMTLPIPLGSSHHFPPEQLLLSLELIASRLKYFCEGNVVERPGFAESDVGDDPIAELDHTCPSLLVLSAENGRY